MEFSLRKIFELFYLIKRAVEITGLKWLKHNKTYLLYIVLKRFMNSIFYAFMGVVELWLLGG